MQIFNHGGDIYTNKNIKYDFSVNINPLGLPNEIHNSLIVHIDDFSSYPDPNCRELCAAISSHEELPVEWILCGNGAADLIFRICYAIKPRRTLICAPTFSEYERALEQVSCKLSYYNLSVENQFTLTENVLENLKQDIDIMFLCNPNNPTGRLISENLLDQILVKAAEKDIIVVVDECFLNFTNGISAKRHLSSMQNLIILKAFTKMYAMAGLRLGYLLTANKTLIYKTENVAQCWSVSVPAQIAGIAALSLPHWQVKTRQIIEEERLYISNEMKKLGITVFQSDANFILIHSKKEFYEPLLKKGIMIRSCENFIGLDKSYYRIGIKIHSDNAFLINAIQEILNG